MTPVEGMKLGRVLILMGFVGAFLLGIVISPLTLRRNNSHTPLEAPAIAVDGLSSEPETILTTESLAKYTGRTAVILTASVHVNARKSPYLLLILPVARSWAAVGFEVLVVLVAHDDGSTPKHEKEFFELLKRQLNDVPHVQCIEFPAPSVPAEITLSQTIRLFLPILLEGWPDTAYIRLSDSDMMIFQGQPFEAKNVGGIDIYNGDCCWPEVPMHSIGMQRKLWISLFEHYLTKPTAEPWTRVSMMNAIMELLKKKFQYEAAFVGHGQKFWGMDQQMAGEMVAKFKNEHAGGLTTHPMERRAHWPFSVNPDLTECHLAGIGIGDMKALQDTVGPLGQGLDVITAKYNSTWLS